MITLTILDKEITIRTEKVAGHLLYNVKDLLEGLGVPTTPHDDMFVVLRELLKHASDVNREFEDTVYEALECLLRGNSERAHKLATYAISVTKIN